MSLSFVELVTFLGVTLALFVALSLVGLIFDALQRALGFEGHIAVSARQDAEKEAKAAERRTIRDRRKAEKAAAPVREMVAKIRKRSGVFHISDEATLPGYHVKTLGWVEDEREEPFSRSDAEVALRDLVVERYPEANVILKMTSNTRSERYRAGTSPKGNAFYRSRRHTKWEAQAGVATPIEEADRPRSWRTDLAIVDGSNVMHWDGEEPKAETVKSVLDILQQNGRTPHVVFDRNAGYRLASKYLSVPELRNLIGENINIEYCPEGQHADIRIIELADDLEAPIVSNDQFRDSARARHIPKMKGFSTHGITELFDPKP